MCKICTSAYHRARYQRKLEGANEVLTPEDKKRISKTASAKLSRADKAKAKRDQVYAEREAAGRVYVEAIAHHRIVYLSNADAYGEACAALVKFLCVEPQRQLAPLTGSMCEYFFYQLHPASKTIDPSIFEAGIRHIKGEGKLPIDDSEFKLKPLKLTDDDAKRNHALYGTVMRYDASIDVETSPPSEEELRHFTQLLFAAGNAALLAGLSGAYMWVKDDPTQN